jgi:hypothetical protein
MTSGHELIRDFAVICDLEGAISTFGRLKIQDVSVKGVLAEVQEAARIIRSGKKVDALNKPIVHEVTVPRKRGGEFKSKSTDIDIISEGTLWQVKAGPTALNDSVKFEAWILQALHYSKQGNPPAKIGLKLDADALNTFNTGPFKAIWDRFKTKHPELGWAVDSF